MRVLVILTPAGPSSPPGSFLRAWTCDHRCEKAWGVNGRRRDNHTMRQLSDDDDDIVYLSDDQVGRAPDDPGTYEGGHAKPMHPEHHNRWCLRECERAHCVEEGKPLSVVDFSRPVYNQPTKHGQAPNAHLLVVGSPLDHRSPPLAGLADMEPRT